MNKSLTDAQIGRAVRVLLSRGGSVEIGCRGFNTMSSAEVGWAQDTNAGTWKWMHLYADGVDEVLRLACKQIGVNLDRKE